MYHVRKTCFDSFSIIYFSKYSSVYRRRLENCAKKKQKKKKRAISVSSFCDYFEIDLKNV